MSTNPELAEYLRATLSQIGQAEKRKMFDVFCFYLNGKAVGFLVEEQALVKTNSTMRTLWPDLPSVLLFEGATNPMWVIDDLDDSDTICELYGRALKYLPAPRAKTERRSKRTKTQDLEDNQTLPSSPLRDPALMGKDVLTEEEINKIKKSIQR